MGVTMFACKLFLLVTLPCLHAETASPVIGVWQSMGPYSLSYYREYQNWVEQFGASTIILPESGDVETVFRSMDAMLLPGGGTVPSPAFVNQLIQRAIHAHHEGEYFPVWGTCLGFQFIVETIAGNSSLQLNAFDSEDQAGNLVFTDQSPGRLFGSANESLRQWFAEDNVIYENHHDGITPTHFAQYPELASMFDILSTGVDKKNVTYVSTMEAKSMPIYGIQFHPEKVRYASHDGTNVPSTPKAVAASDYLASFFVSEARKHKRSVTISV